AAIGENLGQVVEGGEAEGVHEAVFPLAGIVAVRCRAMALRDADLAAGLWRGVLGEPGPHPGPDQQRPRRRALQKAAARDAAPDDETGHAFSPVRWMLPRRPSGRSCVPRAPPRLR